MARAVISSANQASLSALPLASLVAVREHNRWTAARMMASGNGTRSAVPIMVETKLMRPLPSCLRWQREKRTGTGLIVAVALAARAQHLLLQRRNAGDVDQDPVHEDRRQQARPSPGIEKGIDRERDHGVGQPAEPFEKIVRMPRPAPQPDIAD